MVKRGICIALSVVILLAVGITFFSSYDILEIKANNGLLSDRPIIIIDAGHAALENTIKQPKSIAK